MTPIEFANKHRLEIVSEGEGDVRDISGIYCCDLLSMVMGRAKENDALITIMGNVNTVAVGVLADVSCIILCEGIRLEDACVQKAKAQGVCVLLSPKSNFETALMLAKELGICK
ncbi:MAG: DRTGG domain-containing protein [Oscillospiraceae bacterium]